MCHSTGKQPEKRPYTSNVQLSSPQRPSPDNAQRCVLEAPPTMFSTIPRRSSSLDGITHGHNRGSGAVSTGGHTFIRSPYHDGHCDTQRQTRQHRQTNTQQESPEAALTFIQHPRDTAVYPHPTSMYTDFLDR
ncbi:hypothetical protein HYPSUDRAFT_210314 [Hypholoma sublateritium FD-334 SS-4]|uniref:Uncharacterized protein n=1 Tax=Hypholoma sublateritium (strain FD-334 SS-4) TaxID=945553 RepID=A0A0D2LPA6_HYPSF|nr:hypothetical protein HYPSUDRAFT_210314 [Hypholoma sublateritium FD-334 SS-4]